MLAGLLFQSAYEWRRCLHRLFPVVPVALIPTSDDKCCQWNSFQYGTHLIARLLNVVGCSLVALYYLLRFTPEWLIEGDNRCDVICSHMNLSVECTHDMLPGYKSIIGNTHTDDCPGWSPVCTICIIPDQAGLGDVQRCSGWHTR